MIIYKIISDVNEAEKLWNLFSPNEEFYDDWIARSTYNKLSDSPIHFIVGYENEKPVLLLPLQWNEAELSYEIFGGRFFSLNRIFAKKNYEKYFRDLFNEVKKPLFLRWLINPIDGIATNPDDGMFVLYRENMVNIEDYFNKYWKGEKKKKIKKFVRQLNERGLIKHSNRKEDFEKLVEFNIKRFGEKSLFYRDSLRTEYFRKLIDLMNVQITSFELNGEIIAVGYKIIYNNKILGINTGINPEISNIGKYLYIDTIKTMIENNYDLYNALEGDYGWKDIYGFSLLPQYCLNLTNE